MECSVALKMSELKLRVLMKTLTNTLSEKRDLSRKKKYFSVRHLKFVSSLLRSGTLIFG